VHWLIYCERTVTSSKVIYRRSAGDKQYRRVVGRKTRLQNDVSPRRIVAVTFRAGLYRQTHVGARFDNNMANQSTEWRVVSKVKRCSSSRDWETHLRATGHYLSYGITVLPAIPDTGECVPPNPSQKGWYSINISRIWMEGWVRWLVTYTPRWFTRPQTGHPRARRHSATSKNWSYRHWIDSKFDRTILYVPCEGGWIRENPIITWIYHHAFPRQRSAERVVRRRSF